MENWKVLSATMVGRQEKFYNSRRSGMAKTVIFWPWWQPFDSFCFETLSFLPLSPFFLFAMQKSRGPWSPGPLLVSPALNSYNHYTRAPLKIINSILHLEMRKQKQLLNKSINFNVMQKDKPEGLNPIMVLKRHLRKHLRHWGLKVNRDS